MASIPGVRHLPHLDWFQYGHPLGCVFVTISVDGKADTERVRISAPSRTRLGALLAFLVAERLGWEVFDLQRRTLCDRRTFDEALRTHRTDGRTAEEILARRFDWNIRFPELFRFYVGRHTPGVITFGLLMIVMAPCLLIYFLSLPTSAFVWLGMGSGLLIFGVSALVQALLHAARRWRYA